MKKILVVEDNQDMAQVLLLHLKKHGYEADYASTGEEGLQLALSGGYALLILDIGLPGLDGLEVLSQIRKVNNEVQIMMLTSRSEEIDRVVGLDLGADDYVAKPFSVAELMARINARLRRSASPARNHSAMLVFGDLEIDAGSRRVILKKNVLDLSASEFDLLLFLAMNAGQAVSKEQILDRLWSDVKVDYDNALNNLIMRLRKKIEPDPVKARYIKTIRGYGYRFSTSIELEEEAKQD